MVLAENSSSKKQTDRALAFAKRLTAAVSKTYPAGGHVRRRLGSQTQHRTRQRSHWIAGVVEAQKSSFFDADKDLRAALPLVAGNQSRKASALFYLGLANYQLGKMTMKKSQILEAVKFSQDAAAIQGPLTQQAWHNAQVMKDEAAKMR